MFFAFVLQFLSQRTLFVSTLHFSSNIFSNNYTNISDYGIRALHFCTVHITMQITDIFSTFLKSVENLKQLYKLLQRKMKIAELLKKRLK